MSKIILMMRPEPKWVSLAPIAPIAPIAPEARADDQTIFGEGIFLLMKKHGISFSEGKDLALKYLSDQPGMLSYMVKNWEPHRCYATRKEA